MLYKQSALQQLPKDAVQVLKAFTVPQHSRLELGNMHSQMLKLLLPA